MIIKFKTPLMAIIFLTLIGCSSASSIQRAGQSKSGFDGAVFTGETTILRDDIPDSDAYRIFHHGATGFTPVTAVRGSAERRAQQFCDSRGRQYELVRETVSTGAHVLGNFPRAELVFICTEDSESVSKKDATNRYDSLRELKSLYDDGIITQEEYDREKSNILSQ